MTTRQGRQALPAASRCPEWEVGLSGTNALNTGSGIASFVATAELMRKLVTAGVLNETDIREIFEATAAGLARHARDIPARHRAAWEAAQLVVDESLRPLRRGVVH